ncbi:uncharacterized protein DMAD_08529 [Drosophila madeirensis]|uniref:Neuropeptide-like protein 31 n=1 Tax=Drosophila madeirensis TaxID=30013 RepID=A0AAU9F7U5_DROMD
MRCVILFGLIACLACLSMAWGLEETPNDQDLSLSPVEQGIEGQVRAKRQFYGGGFGRPYGGYGGYGGGFGRPYGGYGGYGGGFGRPYYGGYGRPYGGGFGFGGPYGGGFYG